MVSIHSDSASMFSAKCAMGNKRETTHYSNSCDGIELDARDDLHLENDDACQTVVHLQQQETMVGSSEKVLPVQLFKFVAEISKLQMIKAQSAHDLIS